MAVGTTQALLLVLAQAATLAMAAPLALAQALTLSEMLLLVSFLAKGTTMSCTVSALTRNCNRSA